MSDPVIKKIVFAFQVILLCIFVAFWYLLGYGAWTRHQNLKKPCIPYHAGMTLEPGQCTVVKLKAVPR